MLSNVNVLNIHRIVTATEGFGGVSNKAELGPGMSAARLIGLGPPARESPSEGHGRTDDISERLPTDAALPSPPVGAKMDQT
ncbi:hypothetical protein PspLS_07001 [Pyricularia sp. CBS 133598]|nr:hypothetical protein PspLS_07001 [Pyricularia sp. CBS 133598]